MSSANITQIATVANGVISLISVGQEIYELTVKAMDAVEALQYSQSTGAEKKKWVLALTEILIKESDKLVYFVQKILRRKDK